MPLRLSKSRLPGLTTLAVCCAVPVVADEIDDLAARHGGALVACYEATDTAHLADCKGALSEPCMEGEEGGYSTLGMVACTAAETRVWDGYLNAEYRKSRDWARAMDEDDRARFPEFAARAAALLDAQRAWVTFRDAQCRMEYAVWGPGSMRQIAGATCQMEMTAERTIELRGLREAMQ